MNATVDGECDLVRFRFRYPLGLAGQSDRLYGRGSPAHLHQQHFGLNENHHFF